MSMSEDKKEEENIQWVEISEWRQWAKHNREIEFPGFVAMNSSVVAVMPYLRRSEAERSARLMISRAGAPLRVIAVHDDLGIGPIAVWNDVVPHLRCNYIIYCAEDAFAGRYWLRFALQAMVPASTGLLAFNDGKWFGQMAAFGMVRKAWLDRIYDGFLFFPQYSRHYADVELSLIAKFHDALVYSPHSILLEIDYEKDAKETDFHDKLLFKQRATGGFDKRIDRPDFMKFL
ncbi:MAG: hypothetical protein QG612_1, partial [Pseudomonadota bacterium]|nr:hypothetical protein [Pseudomonadota bacterium]